MRFTFAVATGLILLALGVAFSARKFQPSHPERGCLGIVLSPKQVIRNAFLNATPYPKFQNTRMKAAFLSASLNPRMALAVVRSKKFVSCPKPRSSHDFRNSGNC